MTPNDIITCERHGQPLPPLRCATCREAIGPTYCRVVGLPGVFCGSDCVPQSVSR